MHLGLVTGTLKAICLGMQRVKQMDSLRHLGLMTETYLDWPMDS
jgi:hypothetical protein